MSSFNLNQAHFNTQAIHAGYRRDSDFGALATPIYQTSTFTFTSADHAMGVFSGDIPGYDYTRAGNPTVRVFEEKIAQLEAAKRKEETQDEEPQEESGDAKTCSVCGTVSDSNFCPHCGAPMGK